MLRKMLKALKCMKKSLKKDLKIIKTDQEMMKTDLEKIKTDQEKMKTDQEKMKTDLEIMKYRIKYDCWQNIKAANKIPKKPVMTQKEKDKFLEACAYRCQVTGKIYNNELLNRQNAAISHICPQSTGKVPPPIQKIHEFRNLAYFNKKFEAAFDSRRLRFIKCSKRHMPVVDIVDPALHDEIFDSSEGTTFKFLQNVPLDIRRHRPSFVMLSEHAMSTALHAANMGWNQGEHANIVENTYQNGIFEVSPTKEQVEQIKRLQQEAEETRSRPEQTTDSRGERRAAVEGGEGWGGKKDGGKEGGRERYIEEGSVAGGPPFPSTTPSPARPCRPPLPPIGIVASKLDYSSLHQCDFVTNFMTTEEDGGQHARRNNMHISTPPDTVLR